MGDLLGFKKYSRQTPLLRPIDERIGDFEELYQSHTDKDTAEQAARCMDCGVPFCHSGCPLGNLIPDFNDLVYKEDWHNAYKLLSQTNNFPEFTGRICPAPCEKACVLGINAEPVAIEFIEKSIIEKAFEEGWVKPIPPKASGSSVAVIGSGPAGLTAADQLRKYGHIVHVYDKSDAIGGLLRYGIPDFKLEKSIIDRRIRIMEESGIEFHSKAHIGVNVDARQLLDQYDAMVLCCGSTVPRDLPIDGRNASGVHFAMSYLEQSNRSFASNDATVEQISVAGKHVVVIGGGDTGADCVGTSHRRGAKSVTQIELMAKPSEFRTMDDPWPLWPMTLRTSTSHEEGGNRHWALLTKSFKVNQDNSLSGIEVVNIHWNKDQNGKWAFAEVPSTLQIIKADIVFLAMGFLYPNPIDVISQFELSLDSRGNVFSNNYATSLDKVFVAGDMHRGQSLVVWAIAEGRAAAEKVNEYLISK